MIERIVVPLDASLTAEAIVPQVRRLLTRNDSEVILVYAVQPIMTENAITAAEAELAAGREYILGQREKLEQSGVRVKHVVRIGPPVGVILDVVEEEKATMVAMATHGSSGVKRFLFGSVAEGVLRRSPVPVLLVRPFWSYEVLPPGNAAHRPIRNLLLPMDGSERAREALPGVIELAGLFEARVILLRVLGEEEGRGEPAAERADAEKQLGAMAGILEKKGVETISLVEKGDPVGQILKTVRFHEIDLIAMTTHGRSGLARMATGSVTEAVLRQAPVPMLVTRSLEIAPSKAKGSPARMKK